MNVQDRVRGRRCRLTLVVALLGAAGSAHGEGSPRLLERMVADRTAPFCYLHAPGVDPYDAASWTGLYPPADARFNQEDVAEGDRYTVDDIIWQGDGSQGASWLAEPAHLTYSFPADGTTWGLVGVLTGLVDPETGPNNLGDAFEFTFGMGNADRGREYVRQALASWASTSGLTYTEVADDGTAMDQITTRSLTRGDIRIGGFGLGTADGIGAYNAFPNANILGVGGGDMMINTSFLDDPDPLNRILGIPDNNFRLLRNLVAHEHGHGLGFVHQVPCSACPQPPDPEPDPLPDFRLMEPVICNLFDMIQFDEYRAGGANYGDSFAGNGTVGTAHDFGDLTQPVVHSVIETYCSTNGATGANNTNEDWFRFSISSDVDDVAIVADPGLFLKFGPSGFCYETSIQFLGCAALLPQTICPNIAGDLAIELRSADGMTIIQADASSGPGVLEFVFLETLAAGEYTVRVVDLGPNPDPDQDVQLYDLKLLLGTALTPPVAHAGLDKRIAADTNCFFIGDANSRSVEFREKPLPTSGYEWDLDGDGSFEVVATPQPMRQYSSNGVYPVTLRVTDATTFSDEHTINVTVFGATTSLDEVSPAQASVGASVPITINGTNLKNILSASEFSLSGMGVTISGTPIPNALGTEVTGLSLEVDPGASLGARDLSVLNADGSATLMSAFSVVGAICLGDASGDDQVDFADITIALSNWLADYSPGTGPGDANGDGLVNFADITSVLSNWLATCP